jgi:hypothetical protein
MKKIEKLFKNLEYIQSEINTISFERKDTSYRRSGGYFGTEKAYTLDCIVIETYARTKYLNTYKCIPMGNIELVKKYQDAKNLIRIEKDRLNKIAESKWAKESILKARKFAIKQIFDGTIHTNYAKVFFIGNNNIYLAHPYYGHSDYNKCKIMPNTAKHTKVAQELNKVLFEFINK